MTVEKIIRLCKIVISHFSQPLNQLETGIHFNCLQMTMILSLTRYIEFPKLTYFTLYRYWMKTKTVFNALILVADIQS